MTILFFIIYLTVLIISLHSLRNNNPKFKLFKWVLYINALLLGDLLFTMFIDLSVFNIVNFVIFIFNFYINYRIYYLKYKYNKYGCSLSEYVKMMSWTFKKGDISVINIPDYYEINNIDLHNVQNIYVLRIFNVKDNIDLNINNKEFLLIEIRGNINNLNINNIFGTLKINKAEIITCDGSIHPTIHIEDNYNPIINSDIIKLININNEYVTIDEYYIPSFNSDIKKLV